MLKSILKILKKVLKILGKIFWKTVWKRLEKFLKQLYLFSGCDDFVKISEFWEILLEKQSAKQNFD